MIDVIWAFAPLLYWATNWPVAHCSAICCGG